MPLGRDMTSVGIVMSLENRDLISEYATQKGYKVMSDFIRSLIEAEMRANGVKIDLSVDRGGYRIKGGGKSEEE
jgi:hypothetical protein